MTLTTTTQIEGPVNFQFQVALLRNAKALAPYFEGTEPAEIMQMGGTFSAKWRRIENLTPTTTPLAELTGAVSFPTRTATQPTVTDITATVQKFGNFFHLNEEVDVVNFNGQAQKLSEVLGINAGQSLNRLQRNEMEDNSVAIFGGLGTGGTATAVAGAGITESDIAATVNSLNNQDALKFTPMTEGNRNINTTPIRMSYWGITHVDTEEDLRQLTNFVAVERYANQTETAPGEIGHVGGVRWIATTEASIDADSGATITGTSTGAGRTSAGTSYDVYNSVIYGRDAVGSLGFGFNHIKSTYQAGDKLPGVMMIAKARGSAGAADPLDELASLGWRSWHAAQILNSNWIRVVRHTSSKLAA
ncbi:MAG: N4-gp56 family major capsid protein [Geminicoccaceae bacterium]